jgi:molecular chaperone GrpE
MDDASSADIYNEIVQLKDLFQRRLLDDKVKSQIISELTRNLDDQRLVPLYKEIILLLDRIEANRGISIDVDSDSSDFICSIHEELLVILSHYGLEQIETSPVYDYTSQKIISAVTDASMPDMMVIRSVRRGYMLNGSVLRPEEVVVTKSQEADTDVESARSR